MPLEIPSNAVTLSHTLHETSDALDMRDNETCENEEIPLEFIKLTESDEKGIGPHEEIIEIINLGTDENKKEIKVVDNPEKSEIIDLCQEYMDIFAWSYQDMPGLDPDIAAHRIPTYPHIEPKKQKLRRMSPEMSLKIKEEVLKQWEAGFLEVAKYPQWVANIVPVPKKDGRVRMCVDYRDLNKASPKDEFPLPHIDVLVDNTAKNYRYSFMDGYSGYNQILMHHEDKEKTTFITPWGTFCYKVMPFGLKNAGATYQRAMVVLFHDLMHKEVEVYVDDIVAKSGEGESHVEVLRKLFERLRKHKLRLNPNKCVFGALTGKLLGFIVSRKGIEVDPDKIRAIKEMPPPKTEKEVRSFLGRLNYIARFIRNLTATCEPLFRLLRKNQSIEWNEDCQRAYDQIKEYLSSPPVLVPPTPGKPLLLYLTVLEGSMGAILGQHDKSGRTEQAVYYLSKKFNDCESRYSLIERTCCSLAWAARTLRHYMIYYETWLISRMDPIKYIFESPHVSGRVSKWQVILAEYDIKHVTRKSVKGSAIADHLAANPMEEYQPLDFSFPDEHICALEAEAEEESGSRWKMYFDGAVNMYGNGVGAVLIAPNKRQFPVAVKLNFDCTNNMAEYEACITGMQAAISLKLKELDVFGDSALIIYQIKGEWRTKDEKLIPYQKFLSDLCEEFDEITFTHLPRDKNLFADALATLAVMVNLECGVHLQPLRVETRDTNAYCSVIEEEPDGLPWYHDIKRYIQEREYPIEATENDKRTLQRLSLGFFLSGEILYKRSHDGMLLRCVEAKEANKIMAEVHEGVCGTHASGHTLTRQIQRAGYFWMTIERDCIDYVRKCHKCQIYADRINAPPIPLHTLTTPWPFSMWGIDIIGPINPKASNGHRFILVAIDYFTKWVEASSYSSITQRVFVRFLRTNILCRYGVPERIITDNGTNLNGVEVNEFCREFRIKHHNSAPYRPKMNGAVEAANKNIKKIIEKMTSTYKDWHEKLSYALMGYRTTVRTSTGATPFSLTYGMEAVLPIKVEIPSLRVMLEVGLDEDQWIRTRHDQLNLIEGKRLTAMCHGQLYQGRMARAFNKKVHPRGFQAGDLVLRKVLSNHEDVRGKWAPTYEGPYVVKHAFSGGALILTDVNGEELGRPINSDAVKHYFT